MDSIRYTTVLFDWGDTVMKDDPASRIPMVEWETVEAVHGIGDVLDANHIGMYAVYSERRCGSALSGSASLGGALPEALTAREEEVLERIATGLAKQEIAEKLTISWVTVKKQVSHIFRKIGGHRRI